MKNPNGYGSISKLSGKRRKPYIVRAPGKQLPDGSYKREIIGYFKTKKEANIFLAEYIKNPNIIIKDPTIDNLYNIFMENLKASKKSDSTIKMYETTYKYLEDIKNEEVTEIKSFHIQEIINDLIDDGMSYSTVNKVKILSSQIFKLAMADDYIDKNYAQFIELPKKPKPDKRIFSNNEINKLIEYSKENEIAKIILIMVYTSMRPGELLSVTKFNVHLEDNYLRAGSKTESGIDRVIPIHPLIKPHISYFYYKNNSEYLISKDDSSKYNYRHFLVLYYEVLEKLDLTKLSPHKCRKTGLTLLQQAGVNKNAIKRIAGHADYNTTVKYYINETNISELISEINKV